MHICILHIGHTSANETSRHMPSPERFKQGIAPFLKAKWSVVDAVNDTLPDPKAYDGYLITGGKYSAFEDLQWQHDLMAFIQKLHSHEIPLIGICYGHQIIAQALGGKVQRSDKGWGVGIKSTQVIHKPHWLKDAPSEVELYSMHQDQVTHLPQNAKRFLTSDFCTEAGFVVGDHILTIQQHPDFNGQVCKDLIIKRQDKIGKAAKEGLESLTKPHHTELSCQWLADFFGHHCPKS